MNVNKLYTMIFAMLMIMTVFMTIDIVEASSTNLQGALEQDFTGGLTFNDDSSPFAYQIDFYHYDGDAAEATSSGYLVTYVEGPGSLCFYWSIDAPSEFDLTFTIKNTDTNEDYITPTSIHGSWDDFDSKTFEITDNGNYRLAWFFNLNAGETGSAYVDYIVWEEQESNNNPPHPPSNPSPVDNAESVSINTGLSWSCSDPDGDSLEYNVYLVKGDSSPDGSDLVSERQTGKSFNPSEPLDYDSKYYWKIIAFDQEDSTTSSIWKFMTEPDPNAKNPIADFSASPTLGEYPLTVKFTDLSINDPNSWTWGFGDGDISYKQNPSHTYDEIGVYTVTLIVSNEYGSDTKIKNNFITVKEPGLVTAEAGGPYSGNVLDFIDFDASNSNGEDLDYRWDFNGDGKWDTKFMNYPKGWSDTEGDPKSEYLYTNPGTYIVKLHVVDKYGNEDFDETTVKVNNYDYGNKDLAIFIAGGPFLNEWDQLDAWFMDKECTVGYNTFKSLGYDDRDIYFLSYFDGPEKVDGQTTRSNIRRVYEAVKIRSNSQNKVFIHIAGHGSKRDNSITVHDYWDEQWVDITTSDPSNNIDLTSFLDSISYKHCAILLTCCEGGKVAMPHLSGQNRLIFTEVDGTTSWSDNPFSDKFFELLQKGYSYGVAWEEGDKAATNHKGPDQRDFIYSPQIDDNADGWSHGTKGIDKLPFLFDFPPFVPNDGAYALQTWPSSLNKKPDSTDIYLPTENSQETAVLDPYEMKPYTRPSMDEIISEIANSDQANNQITEEIVTDTTTDTTSDTTTTDNNEQTNNDDQSDDGNQNDGGDQENGGDQSNQNDGDLTTYYLSFELAAGEGSVKNSTGQVYSYVQSYPYTEGSTLTLTAMPDQGFVLDKWGGNASGSSNPLTITMDSDKHIEVYFALDWPMP